MARFLTTAGIASSIEEIIRKASSSLVLITPYLKLSKQFEQRLKDANKRKVQIMVIFGKSTLAKEELEKLNRLEHLELLFCENLHAKCYLNEDSMVMSSMNLHEFSERYNREMGILLNKEEDGDIFEDVLSEIESIKSWSRSIKQKLFQPGIVKPYVNLTDFHLPLIQKMLEAEFPDKGFEIETAIIKCNFKDGLRLHVDHRVIFRFDSIYEWRNLRKMLEKTAYKDRCFWNEKTLHFYLPKEHRAELNEDGQLYISEYLMDFIKETVKLIK